MAFLYRRSRSPYYWVSYIDLAGERRKSSTKLRHGVAPEARKARELCRELAAKESQRLNSDEAWGDWVASFIEERYANRLGTLSHYRNSWRNISAFLETQHLHVPRQLSRQHVREYVRWRQERHAESGCYEVSKNTALHEIKLLRILMHEAVQCGYASVNPCERLGIPMDQPPRKPRITDAEHGQILAALEKEPEWMRVSYAIAWEQGCRFSETCLPLSDCDLVRKVIRFRTKGHKDSVAEFPLAPQLIPLIRELKRKGNIRTFEMPDMPGKQWWLFFKRIGLRHLCFHCTRVTFITRCYEAGVPRDMVMRLVGHSTYAAHACYPRLTADHSTAQAMRQLL
jgi:integrase